MELAGLAVPASVRFGLDVLVFSLVLGAAVVVDWVDVSDGLLSAVEPTGFVLLDADVDDITLDEVVAVVSVHR